MSKKKKSARSTIPRFLVGFIKEIVRIAMPIIKEFARVYIKAEIKKQMRKYK